MKIDIISLFLNINLKKLKKNNYIQHHIRIHMSTPMDTYIKEDSTLDAVKTHKLQGCCAKCHPFAFYRQHRVNMIRVGDNMIDLGQLRNNISKYTNACDDNCPNKHKRVQLFEIATKELADIMLILK